MSWRLFPSSSLPISDTSIHNSVLFPCISAGKNIHHVWSMSGQEVCKKSLVCHSVYPVVHWIFLLIYGFMQWKYRKAGGTRGRKESSKKRKVKKDIQFILVHFSSAVHGYLLLIEMETRTQPSSTTILRMGDKERIEYLKYVFVLEQRKESSSSVWLKDSLLSFCILSHLFFFLYMFVLPTSLFFFLNEFTYLHHYYHQPWSSRWSSFRRFS